MPIIETCNYQWLSNNTTEFSITNNELYYRADCFIMGTLIKAFAYKESQAVALLRKKVEAHIYIMEHICKAA
jgi:hypothetical protein